jgi:hypothetical protein
MTDTREHSELSLSSSERWVACPGSIFLIRNIEVPPAGPEAERGTKVHEFCAVILGDFLKYKLEGSDPVARANKMVSDYELEDIENAHAYSDTIWKEVLDQSITHKAYGIEEKFIFDEKLDIYGTVDFWCIYIDDRAKRAAVIVDYKNGYNYVDEKSGQLKSYACALRQEIRNSGKDIDYVKTCIFQPRCLSAAPFRSAQFTVKQLSTWEKKMFKAANQIYVKKKPAFKVGDHCKWCPAKSICKAYAKEIENQTSLALITPDNVVLPAPEIIPDDKLANIILHSDAIEDFLKACKAYCLNRHLSGKPLPGLKAVLSNTRRCWRDDEILITKTLKEMGIKEEDLFQPAKLQTITYVEKKLGRGKLDDLTTMSEAKPILVPSNDARLEIKDGLAMLETVPEDQ